MEAAGILCIHGPSGKETSLMGKAVSGFCGIWSGCGVLPMMLRAHGLGFRV